MKSNMQYVIFILILFALQILVFTNFKEYESGLRNKAIAYEKLKEKNQKLAFELATFKNKSERSPASIAVFESANLVKKTFTEPIDMSEFYFSKYRELTKNHQDELALKYLEKIKINSLNSSIVSKALFYKVQVQCKNDILDSCLADIDALVTQYPDSEWTGRALIFLKKYYEKHQRRTEALLIKNIIQQNFAKNQKILESIKL